VIKENGGGCEFKYDIFDRFIRIFVNATMYPHSALQQKSK
jgi:hypothetical protein